MKIKRVMQLATLSRYHCFGLILSSSLIVTACGDSTSAVAPDIGSAVGQVEPEPEKPATNPESPTTNTETPGTEPETPTTEPETPTTEPETPTTEPETSLLDDSIALSGSVNSYPSNVANENGATNDSAQILDDEITESSSLTRADMRPVQALVSLFLLSDVNFQTPIATVKSDIDGNYDVTADDVKDYLLRQELIDDTATDDDVLASFRALGRLQVRALIVRERDGVKRAMAIQSLANPADVDENGTPVPVTIDPIVHRVVKVIVDSIRDSVANLESMGLSPMLVDQLINTVVEEVVSQIDQILEETEDEVIAIPEGFTLDDVIENQEDELELNVEQEQIDQLAVVLDGTEVKPEEDQLQVLEGAVAGALEIADREKSTVASSLNSESQGLLSGFESTLNGELNGNVEQRINEARQVGTEEALSEVFGESKDGVALEQALASVELQKKKLSRLSIQRFLLSLGLGVVVDENEAGDAGVVALQLPLPYHLDTDLLPGAAGLGERQIRLFKVGSGELDADSEYTANPFVQLGVLDGDGAPMPPFKYVPALGDVVAQVLPGTGIEQAQLAVDEARDRVNTNALATPEDYQLLDRVAVLYELRERLHDTTLVSSSVVDALITDNDRKIPIKRIAAAIAQEFEWIQEDIKLTPDGFPIYSGRRGTLTGGASSVDSSELIRSLSMTLGESPVSTVNKLTESNGFLAQFAPRAIELALQRYDFEGRTELIDALLEIYPSQPDGYRELITGSISGQTEPEYDRARDRVARGLTTAIPSNMYGQTLTSDSVVNIQSALFFLDFSLRRDYLIDSNRSFYTKFEITRADGSSEVRYVPDYANIKRLEPSGDVSVSAIISELLNITPINDGQLFRTATTELMDSLQNIPSLSDYRDHDVEEYIADLGPRIDSATATCTVQMFDGSDPDSGEDHQRLNVSVFEVDYSENAGEPLKRERVDAGITSNLVQDTQGNYRTYRISGLPTKLGDAYGKDYVLRFEIDSYQNELPEIYFYADGFVPEINLCDTDSPLYIGQDQTFSHLPSLWLVSEQTRIHHSVPTEPGSVDVDGNASGKTGTDNHYEWVDLSNLEVPGAPLYLTELEESKGLGIGDFRFTHDGEKLVLRGPADGDIGFARLYGTYVDGKLQVSLNQTDTLLPLSGLQSVVGANLREIISAVTSGETNLTESLPVAVSNSNETDSSSGSVNERDESPEPAEKAAVLDDDSLYNTFEADSLYLFKDQESRYWVLELRYFDTFIDYDNTQKATIDIGVASINNIGVIDVPNVSYDIAQPDEISYPNEIDESYLGGLQYYHLYYGDWLVLENPTEYNGSKLLLPEVLTFTPSEDYEQLRQAIDGIAIRYAGDHFSENITSFDDIDTTFGIPPDFSSVPVRLDAGRDGISFVKITFDKTEKRYVMDRLPQDSARYANQLSHNDLVAIFDDQSTSDEPKYLARIIRDTEDSAINGYIGIEVIRYLSITDRQDKFDERQVICILEDDGNCPERFPSLFSSTDSTNIIGVVYDSDVDGVPSLFDPNDNDPNIPGLKGFGDGYPADIDIISNEDLTIESVVGVSDDGSTVHALIAKTGAVYPGDIEYITLESDLFGIDSPAQIVLSCETSTIDSFFMDVGVHCMSHPVSDDIDLEIYRKSESGVSLLMVMPPQKLSSLGDYVEISYQINYRVPTDADGKPLICDDEVCNARPVSSGVITIPTGHDIPVHSQVSVQLQDQVPELLLGLREIDVDKEFRISATSLEGAIKYELNIYCPSSSQSSNFDLQDFYQPEEDLKFYAPAQNELGEAIPPEFHIHTPWLAGRECDISLRTPIETESGNIAGISLYVQGGVKMHGVGDDPVFLDNESVFKAGDNVCISEDSQLTTDNCSSIDALFSVQSLEGRIDTQGQVTLDLGKDVVEAQAFGDTKQLLRTSLKPGAALGFDGIDLGFAPACGEVSGTAQSESICDSVTEEFQSTFMVSADGQELLLLLQDVVIDGPVNEQGNISLIEPGYYRLVNLINLPDTSTDQNNEGIDPRSGPQEFMNVIIEVYEDPIGEREAFAVFERNSYSDFNDENGAVRQLRAEVPSHISMQTVQDQFVELEARAIVDEHLKVKYYIEMPVQLDGTHDLNEDGLPDIEVTSEEDIWIFRFTPSVDGVNFNESPDEQEIPADASGYRTATFSTDQGFVEMLVRIEDIEYVIVADFNLAGFSELQIVSQHPVAEELLEPLFEGQEFEHFFPVNLSSASPFIREQNDVQAETAEELSIIHASESVSGSTSGLHTDAERIAGILRGRFRLADFLRASNLRATSTNAHCFGPQLFYQNHPDGMDAEPMIDFADSASQTYPSLPTGDLGIWTEHDHVTGDACAAAQMNAQLDAARRRTFSALITLASVARKLSPEQQIAVLSGAEVSVIEKMNALSLPNVFFEQASIARQNDSGEWVYRVMLFDMSADGANGQLTSIEMDFNPGNETEIWDYSGTIRMRVQDNVDTPQCADSAVEHLSSLVFEHQGQDHLRTEFRSGTHCGHGGINGFDTDGAVDPLYSAAVAVGGWRQDFSIFTANVKPSNGAGTYAYSWQAGPSDSHSRVLNVRLNDSEPVDGEAWFGYGQSLTTDSDAVGEINGFICNWAGPGNNHRLIERAQRQSLVYDRTADLFVVPEGGSNITYAPTVACTYNSDDGGSFLYDRNLDGALADESADSVDVGTGEQLPFDLAPPDSSTYFGMDIEKVIRMRGFVSPERPTTAR